MLHCQIHRLIMNRALYIKFLYVNLLFLNGSVYTLQGTLFPTRMLPTYTVLNACFFRSSMGLREKSITLVTMLRADTNQVSVHSLFSKLVNLLGSSFSNFT